MKEYKARMDALVAKLRDYVRTKEGDDEIKAIYNEAFACYSEILLNEGNPINEVIKMFENDILNPDYERDLILVIHTVRAKSIIRGAK